MGSVLEGCEVVCFEGQKTDLIGCPLPFEEQEMCYGYRQFHAGIREAGRRTAEAEFRARKKLDD